MEKLPLDILALIATKLPCEALLRCALVSKAWHRTFTQPVLFRRLAIALGAPRNAAADDSKKWRRIWWHARQVVVWPGKRQLTDRDVTEWVSYRASKGGPLEIALMDPFEGQKMATAAALRELCVSLTGSIDALYEIPPTPQGMCAGMPPGHCRVDLPRLRVPIVLFRSRMNFDSGCYDIYTHRGHLFCSIGVGDEVYSSEKNDEAKKKLSCLLEVRPCGAQPSTRMQEQAKRQHCPFISLVSPVRKEDTLWALELMAEWAVERSEASMTQSPRIERSEGCVVC